MEIMGYIIPSELQNDTFIMSIKRQYDLSQKLTPKQQHALIDTIGVTLDFYEWDFDLKTDDSDLQKSFEDLMAKVRRNKFRTARGHNKCVRAINSIVDGTPNWGLIDDALGKNYKPYRRY